MLLETAPVLITDQHIETIRRGGLVIFPTETLYGLGCCARDEAALRRLFEAKGRPPGQPPPVLVADREQLASLTTAIPDIALELMSRHWPGALTLVLKARRCINPLLTTISTQSGVRTVGVRQSGHPVAHELCARVGAPIVATSANISGAIGPAANPRSLDDIPETLRAQVDLILDGGEVSGLPSTVVDCTGPQPVVLRRGAVRL